MAFKPPLRRVLQRTGRHPFLNRCSTYRHAWGWACWYLLGCFSESQVDYLIRISRSHCCLLDVLDLFDLSSTASLNSSAPSQLPLYCVDWHQPSYHSSKCHQSWISQILTASSTFLQQGTSRAQGVFIEMFVTGALVLSVLMLAAEKHQATAFAPVRGYGGYIVVDFTHFFQLDWNRSHLICLSPVCLPTISPLRLHVYWLSLCSFAVYYTGAAMNTARAFGPAVISGFHDPDHWVVSEYRHTIIFPFCQKIVFQYWLGPFLGSLLGTGFYIMLKQYVPLSCASYLVNHS